MQVGDDGNATVGPGEFRGAHVLDTMVLDVGGELRCEVPHTRTLDRGARVLVSVDEGHRLAAFPAVAGSGDTVSSAGPAPRS